MVLSFHIIEQVQGQLFCVCVCVRACVCEKEKH